MPCVPVRTYEVDLTETGIERADMISNTNHFGVTML